MKPLLIFNGDCGFCRLWVRRWKQLTGDRVDYAPSQEVGKNYPEIPASEFERSVQLVMPDGQRLSAAAAVYKTFDYAGHHWLWRMYSNIPGVAPLMEWSYALIASHRPLAHRLTHVLWGDPAQLSTYDRVRPLYLRSLAFVYALAFASLAIQIMGLLGREGIFPAADLLRQVAERTGFSRFWYLPTLAWFSASDTFLKLLCWSGVVVAGVSVLCRPNVWRFGFLWVAYLSLVVVGGPFTGFQWDALLLEAGFLAIFMAGSGARVWLWLTRWLLFRLMFLSAWVKLASGDPLWQNLKALTVHFQTQPIPNPLSWYVHHAPVGLQEFSCGVLFFIEGVVPFLIFFPRHGRYLACGLLIFLQILIGGTGNYAFFNILAIVLCLTLLDDQAFLPRKPR